MPTLIRSSSEFYPVYSQVAYVPYQLLDVYRQLRSSTEGDERHPKTKITVSDLERPFPLVIDAYLL